MGVPLTKALQRQLRDHQQTQVLALVYTYQLCEQLHLDARNQVQLGLPLQGQATYTIHEDALVTQLQLPQLLALLHHPGASLREADLHAVHAALVREKAFSTLEQQLIAAVHHRDYPAMKDALQKGASPDVFTKEEQSKFPPWLKTCLQRSDLPPAGTTWRQLLGSILRESAQSPSATRLQRLKRKRRKSLERHEL